MNFFCLRATTQVLRDAEQTARSRLMQVQIPGGPEVIVPFGRRMHRVRHGNTKWRLRMDPETGALLHVGKPTRKRYLFFIIFIIFIY